MRDKNDRIQISSPSYSKAAQKFFIESCVHRARFFIDILFNEVHEFREPTDAIILLVDVSSLRTNFSIELKVADRRAGALLFAALILFIVSHDSVNWSTFDFKYKNLGAVRSGLWRQQFFFNETPRTFALDCAKQQRSCTMLIIAR